ncbi:MAG TPA: hypothetical protein VNW06_03360 [Cytophagaceae bacterium]|jgi:hypothetical protein|nr:hypothetical protein [Cytophagaceae bacterium]
MSNVAQHINNQSYLFESSKNRVSMSVSIFLLRFLTNWYARRLDILRAEILGFITMLEKKELNFDNNSYLIFRKIFRMVYYFNEAISKDHSPSLYKVKMSLNQLCETLKTLLAIYEKENFADHNYPIDIIDDSDWVYEKK